MERFLILKPLRLAAKGVALWSQNELDARGPRGIEPELHLAIGVDLPEPLGWFAREDCEPRIRCLDDGIAEFNSGREDVAWKRWLPRTKLQVIATGNLRGRWRSSAATGSEYEDEQADVDRAQWMPLPNESRLSCGHRARRALYPRTIVRARQRTTVPIPLKR